MRNPKGKEEYQAKCEEAVKGLAVALKKVGIKYKTWHEQFSGTARISLVDGDIHAEISFVAEQTYGHTNGNLRIVLGNHMGQAKQFPPRKNGFDYDAIAAEVKCRLEQGRARDVAYAKKERSQKANDAAVERIKKQVDVPNQAWLTSNSAGLTIKFDRLTEEQAHLILKEAVSIFKLSPSEYYEDDDGGEA